MDAQERAALIERYRGGVAAVREAVAGLDDQALDRRSPEGEGSWTAREVIHHLADSEMTSAIRLRRLLAEDAPVIDGYDEEAFAKRFTLGRAPASSLMAVEGARATSLEILERLDESDWARAGTHSESGRYGVTDWLRIYAVHPYEHADQIRRAARTA